MILFLCSMQSTDVKTALFTFFSSAGACVRASTDFIPLRACTCAVTSSQPRKGSDTEHGLLYIVRVRLAGVRCQPEHGHCGGGRARGAGHTGVVGSP